VNSVTLVKYLPLCFMVLTHTNFRSSGTVYLSSEIYYFSFNILMDACASANYCLPCCSNVTRFHRRSQLRLLLRLPFITLSSFGLSVLFWNASDAVFRAVSICRQAWLAWLNTENSVAFKLIICVTFRVCKQEDTSGIFFLLCMM
jgi:hypothetical protein